MRSYFYLNAAFFLSLFGSVASTMPLQAQTADSLPTFGVDCNSDPFLSDLQNVEAVAKKNLSVKFTTPAEDPSKPSSTMEYSLSGPSAAKVDLSGESHSISPEIAKSYIRLAVEIAAPLSQISLFNSPVSLLQPSKGFSQWGFSSIHDRWTSNDPYAGYMITFTDHSDPKNPKEHSYPVQGSLLSALRRHEDRLSAQHGGIKDTDSIALKSSSQGRSSEATTSMKSIQSRLKDLDLLIANLKHPLNFDDSASTQSSHPVLKRPDPQTFKSLEPAK